MDMGCSGGTHQEVRGLILVEQVQDFALYPQAKLSTDTRQQPQQGI